MQQLQAYGLPRDMVSKLFNSATLDIVALATRLAMIGLIAACLKSALTAVVHWIERALFTTVHVRATAGGWITSYMAANPDVQAQLSDYRLSAVSDQDDQEFDPAYPGASRSKREKRAANYSWKAPGMLVTLQEMDHRNIVVKMGKAKIWINSSDTGFGGSKASPLGYRRLRTWSWNKHLIKEFILKAYEVHHQRRGEELHIFNHAQDKASWIGPLRRPIRPWSSVFLPNGVKDNLLEDVKAFLSPEEQLWYATKGVPHRRGYMLHGPPGSGKTTLATALASQLRLDLYCVNPAMSGMDDTKLEKCFQNCPKGSLLLIEDIDCVMPTRKDALSGNVSTQDSKPGNEKASTVTLSGVLNAIDGIASQEDSVLFASTNFPDRLDEAVRRPGRFDVFVEFNYANRDQIEGLYRHFYTGTGDQPIQNLDRDPDEKAELLPSLSYGDQTEVGTAGAKFADVVAGKGIKVSVATVQGYLLLYKKDPKLALAKAEDWAEGIRVQQDV